MKLNYREKVHCNFGHKDTGFAGEYAWIHPSAVGTEKNHEVYN